MATYSNYNYNTITIWGTAYTDSINNFDSYVSINAGAGVDTIDNRGSYTMIEGGASNDLISLLQVAVNII